MFKRKRLSRKRESDQVDHKAEALKRMKVKKSMDEFKAGSLHSGSKEGPVVKDKAQAIAIGISEGKKEAK